MTGEEILKIKFMCRDLGEVVTIKKYLKKLLKTLLREGEGFSGKRPFGNSGWQCDLAQALVLGGAINGEIEVYHEGTEDEHIEADGYSWSDVDAALTLALKAL